MTDLDVIREACVRANPEIIVLREAATFTGEILEENRTIRLADVLLAIHAKAPANKTLITLESDGQFVVHWMNFSKMQSKLGPTWNLLKDSLEDQSPKTLSFIADLLR